jgi:hypothetical protein
LDAREIFLVQQIDRQRFAPLDRGIEIHGDGDEPEMIAPFQIGRGMCAAPPCPRTVTGNPPTEVNRQTR